LDKAQQLASSYQYKLNTLCIDLEHTSNEELIQKLPKVDLIHVARYLHRPLFPTIIELVLFSLHNIDCVDKTRWICNISYIYERSRKVWKAKKGEIHLTT